MTLVKGILIMLVSLLISMDKSVIYANELSTSSISQENNVLIKRAPEFNINAFIDEVRNEFRTFTKLNPIVFIAIGGVILSLIIFYIFARIKYPEGRSTIIFTVALIVLDLCLDIAFVIYNVNDVPYLFLPSLLTILVPAGVNVLFAFVLMIQQTFSKTNKKFRRWLHNHHAGAGTFTLLSMFHIEILRLLTSNFLRLDIFKAPFDNTAKKWLFSVGLLNVVIEDIPQFIILILYFRGVGTNFTFVPILTLLISSISLLSSIINRIYELISFLSMTSTNSFNSFRNSYHYKDSSLYP